MFMRVRRVFSFPATSSTSASKYANVVAKVVPSANSVVLRSTLDNSSWGNGAIYSLINTAASNYITRFRAIAGCARLLNMASYTETTGLVAGVYAPDGMGPDSSYTPDDTIGMYSAVRANSKEAMEVKWFPTLNDTTFRAPDDTPSTGEMIEDSSMSLMATGIDAKDRAANTSHTPNMKLEVVMVYEYQPGLHATGVSIAAKAPYGNLTNVLASIGDLTAAAIGAYTKYGQAAGLMLNAVSSLSGGTTGFTGNMARLRIEDAL